MALRASWLLLARCNLARTQRQSLFVLLAPSLFLLLAQPAAVAQDCGSRILLIVLDDVGLDKLTMYGSSAVTGGAWDQFGLTESLPELPNLERIANQGVMFTHAYAAPRCSATRAQILSGRYAFETGMLRVADPVNATDFWRLDPARFLLLPQLLSGASCSTAAFGKWHLTGWASQTCHPIECGFALFEGHMVNNGHSTAQADNHFSWPRVHSEAPVPSVCNPSSPPTSSTVTQYDAEVTAADASAFLDLFRISSGGFFAQVCFSPPHVPLQWPPRKSISTNALTQIKTVFGLANDAAYDAIVGTHVDWTKNDNTDTDKDFVARLCYRAMLESVDYYIGEMLHSDAEEETVTDLDNTLILVVGDNGTAQELMQIQTTGVSASGAPALAGHGKRSLYEPGIRVPLLAYSSDSTLVAGPATCDELISTVDLWSTVAEIAGIPTNDPPSSSVSFRSLLLDPSASDPQTIVREFVYQEVGESNGYTLEQGTSGLKGWQNPVGTSLSPLPFNYIRTVIRRNGQKYIRTCRPVGTSFTPCDASGWLAPCGGSGEECDAAAGNEYYEAFSSPNEISTVCPSVNAPAFTIDDGDWLRCTMQSISGN